MATVYKTKVTLDNRGNENAAADLTDPIRVTAAFLPQRSARAEVPGQAEIDVTRMIVDADVDGLDLWSLIDWNGAQWDVVAPPAYHHGTRHSRHWSIDIRRRP